MAWEDDAAGLADAVEEAFGVSVTVRRKTPGARAAATGVRAVTTADTTVTAVRGRARVERDGGAAPIEEVVYTVKASRLSFRPDAGDEIIDGSATRPVVVCELSVDELLYEITTRRAMIGG